MSLSGQFRCQRTAAAGRLDASIGRHRPQRRFERSRASSVALRRKQRVVTTTAMSDGGRMSFDETQKALDMQLKQSSLSKKEEAEGNLSNPASISQSLKTEADVIQEKAVSSTITQKTEAENVQRGVLLRTGSMDDDQITNAIQRQVGATPADWSGDEEEDESIADIVIVDESAAAEKAKEDVPDTSSAVKSGEPAPEPAEEPAQASPESVPVVTAEESVPESPPAEEVKDEKVPESPPVVAADESAPESPPAEEAEEEEVPETATAGSTADDGTLVFSAEALQAVAYDDIELPKA